MKKSINTKAKLLFAACLLVSTIAGAIWYVFSVSQYATYRVDTREPVSGLIADAPVEFHGVEVGKVKSVKLVNAQKVDILLSIDKTAPVTAATVATITSRGLATRGFTGYVFHRARKRRHRFPAATLTPRRPVSHDPGGAFESRDARYGHQSGQR